MTAGPLHQHEGFSTCCCRIGRDHTDAEWRELVGLEPRKALASSSKGTNA